MTRMESALFSVNLRLSTRCLDHECPVTTGLWGTQLTRHQSRLKVAAMTGTEHILAVAPCSCFHNNGLTAKPSCQHPQAHMRWQLKYIISKVSVPWTSLLQVCTPSPWQLCLLFMVSTNVSISGSSFSGHCPQCPDLLLFYREIPTLFVFTAHNSTVWFGLTSIMFSQNRRLFSANEL